VQGIADASRDGADLHVDVGKTETTKIAPRAKLGKTTDADVVGLDLDVDCEHCDEAFLTEAGLRPHEREHCQQARVPTWERTFDVDSIVDVRGAPDRRWHRTCGHGDDDHGKVVQGVRPGEPSTPTCGTTRGATASSSSRSADKCTPRPRAGTGRAPTRSQGNAAAKTATLFRSPSTG